MRGQLIQKKALFWLISTAVAVYGQESGAALDGGRGEGMGRYAVILKEPPLALSKSANKAALSAQQAVLAGRLPGTAKVFGADQVLLNVLFVAASREEARAIAAWPEVDRVETMRPLKLLANRAFNLINGSGGWQRVAGESNAGQGVRIGLIDTGIDHTHPAFAANGLTPPPGFPRCSRPFAETEQCAQWTNGKVIVARSYVDMLNFQYGNAAIDTRPDDVLPRDRVGHGTMAAMVAAGGRVRGPSAEIVGVAPRAWIGNYKVFGSPGVNDGTFGNVVLEALKDAARDGMNIVTLNLGYSAEWPPLERTCGQNRTSVCDFMADAVHNATLGVASENLPPLTILAAAGNEGDLGFQIPSLGTVSSPATAPGAIAVGAFTNSHVWVQSLRLSSGTIGPRNIRFTDGPRPAQPLTLPLRNAAPLDDDKSGQACRPLPAGSLTGAAVLIKRGECTRDYKVNNAQAAGAAAVIFYNEDSEDLSTLLGLANTGIPSVLAGTSDGALLANFLETNPGGVVTLDPQYREITATDSEIAIFSSQGLPLGEGSIKPEVVAPGTDLYMATQKYDPNAGLYDASGFGVSQGTSFATPIAAGVAALVKQLNPNFTPPQVKSALVNTADGGLFDYDYNNRRITARHRAAGGGKLNAGDATATNLTADPATVSFGILRVLGRVSRGVLLRNHSQQTMNLRVSVDQIDRDDNYRVGVNGTAFTLAAGATTQLTLTVDGARLPAPGVYDGWVTITGGATEFRVPYTYVVPDNVPFNIYPLSGDNFVRPSNRANVGFSFKVVDQFGAPVVDAPIRLVNGKREDFATEKTDVFGIGEGNFVLSATPGRQSFSLTVGKLTIPYDGVVKPRPTVPSNGVVDVTGQVPSRGFAPGSYISLFGSGLSDILKVVSTPYLPVSLAGVSVSFDNVGASVSVPGRLHFVSPGQINVQIPWECRGLTSVTLKVSIGEPVYSTTFDIPIANEAPAAFEYTEANSQRSAAALDEFYNVVGQNNPVRRGRPVQLFFNGLGDVTNRPPSGEPPGANLASTRSTPSVSIGGREAQVQFSGLAPGLVGVYQVNVVLPSDTPSGRQPVSLTINGITSRNTFLSVQP